MSKLQVDNIVNKADNGSPTLSKGAIVTGVCTSTSFDGSLNATQLASGTIPDARFPSTLPAIDGSQLTGIQAGVANFVATGTVANGAPVIVKDDGTVASITQTTDPSSSPSVGAEAVFENAAADGKSVTYDSNSNRVVVAYRDSGNGNYGTCVVGTVNPDETITFGSPVVFNSGQTDLITAVFDSTNNKIVISYQDITNSNRGTVIVGTVDPSDNSIEFGSEVQFRTDSVGMHDDNSMTFIGGGKVFIAFSNATYNSRGESIVGTVTGTAVTFGSIGDITSNQMVDPTVAYDANAGKVLVAYRDSSDSNKGKARVATVTGTSISFGTEVTFNNGSTQACTAVYDSSNQKVPIAYRDSGNSNYGTAIVGTITGTAVTFGNEAVFESDTVWNVKSTFDSTNNKMVIVYSDSGNSGHGTVVVAGISDTSISFNTPFVYNGAEISYNGLAFIANGQSVVAYRDYGNNNYGTARVINSLTPVSNLTAENYIGLAAGAISNSASGSITISGGINESQTGLTTGRTYYVRGDGTLNTVAGNPSVVAGTSISSTKIIVKG